MYLSEVLTLIFRQPFSISFEVEFSCILNIDVAIIFMKASFDRYQKWKVLRKALKESAIKWINLDIKWSMRHVKNGSNYTFTSSDDVSTTLDYAQNRITNV